MRGLVGPRDVARAAHPSFALLVLALGVAVAAVSTGFLGDLVERLVPSGTSFLALLAVAVLATVLANLLTNLSATILLVPLVAPLGTTAVLAALLGLNIGSGLTWTGSLANLLWRRTLVSAGRRVSSAEFYRVSLVITPVSPLPRGGNAGRVCPLGGLVSALWSPTAWSRHPSRRIATWPWSWSGSPRRPPWRRPAGSAAATRTARTRSRSTRCG